MRYAVLALLIMVGCVPPAPSPVRTPLDMAELAPYRAPGTAVLSGQAFLKTRGGDVKYGAGCQVQVVPITSYQRERIQRKTMGNERLEEQDPRIEAFTKKTIADGSGNFEVKGLAAGQWVVYCSITWEVPGRYYPERTGGVAFAVVTLGEGESRRVIVTR